MTTRARTIACDGDARHSGRDRIIGSEHVGARRGHAELPWRARTRADREAVRARSTVAAGGALEGGTQVSCVKCNERGLAVSGRLASGARPARARGNSRGGAASESEEGGCSHEGPCSACVQRGAPYKVQASRYLYRSQPSLNLNVLIWYQALHSCKPYTDSHTQSAF